jgi:hypothetical protein
MRISPRALLASILLLAFVMAGCNQVMDLAPLRSKLIEQFHQDDVNLSVNNGSMLMIGFNNSEFNKLEEDEQKAKAREIAKFAKEHYDSIAGITTIRVVFVDKTNLIIINASSSSGYSFDVGELS